LAVDWYWILGSEQENSYMCCWKIGIQSLFDNIFLKKRHESK
jgi:hypothetical protein